MMKAREFKERSCVHFLEVFVMRINLLTDLGFCCMVWLVGGGGGGVCFFFGG